MINQLPIVMTSLFNKRKRTSVTDLQNERPRIIKRLEESCIRLQRSFAEWMQGKSERLSKQGKLTLLLLFILLSSGFSLYVLAEGLWIKYTTKQAGVFQLSRIKTPLTPVKHGRKEGVGNIRDGPVLSKIEYREIHRIKLYMDSLSHSPLNSSGRSLYDSISRKRPGLMDSLRLVEHLYPSQTK
ncbi:MAG TPA: hypothetical protein VFX43_20185 [Chitinophagaceae bacterium]|nr:hypothetical protein [Chitinophagaceae bacterium]